MGDSLSVIGFLGELSGREQTFSAMTPVLAAAGGFSFPEDFEWESSPLAWRNEAPAHYSLSQQHQLDVLLAKFARGDLVWLAGPKFVDAATFADISLPTAVRWSAPSQVFFHISLGSYGDFRSQSRRIYREAKGRYIETQFARPRKKVAANAFMVLDSLSLVDRQDQMLMRGIHYFIHRELESYFLVREFAVAEGEFASNEAYERTVEQAVTWYSQMRGDDLPPAGPDFHLLPTEEADDTLLDSSIYQRVEEFLRGAAPQIDDSRASVPNGPEKSPRAPLSPSGNGQ